MGGNAAAHVYPLGGAAALQGRLDRGEPGRGSRYQVGDDPHQRRRRLRLDEDGERRAPAGAHLPFDSSARRHTSFASVGAYPVIDESIDIEVLDKDLRVDTYRASGAGGQHVNRTDSAVRLTHLPTGIVVQCQNDRSQHRNRAMAMQMLKARLYELELRKREEAVKAEHEQKSDIGWGHQIRSYVLQPYQMIKDLRTGVETSNTQAVLDGDLDDFMVAALAGQTRDKRGKGTEKPELAS